MSSEDIGRVLGAVSHQETHDTEDGDGDCYKVAAEILISGIHDGRSPMLCHGIVTGRGPLIGVNFGHAWVEIKLWNEEIVIDNSNGNEITMRKSAYYKFGSIHENSVNKYNRKQTLSNIFEFKHWGPWETETTSKEEI